MLKNQTKPLMVNELDLDVLEHVTGGIGSGGKVETEGTVVEVLPNAMFKVDIGGQTITASISGKLRMNFVRILVGDRVKVEYHPDDLTQYGRVTGRFK